MHLGTIVKIKAQNEKEALDKVQDLVTDNGEYGAYNSGSSGFDYCDESAIQIAKNDNGTPFTEEDFKAGRKQELEQSKDFRERAARERELDPLHEEADTDAEGNSDEEIREGGCVAEVSTKSHTNQDHP